MTTGSDAANTVQQIENSCVPALLMSQCAGALTQAALLLRRLSPNQMQQFQQLQQQNGRKLQQGPSTQKDITTIGELNQGAQHI